MKEKKLRWSVHIVLLVFCFVGMYLVGTHLMKEEKQLPDYCFVSFCKKVENGKRLICYGVRVWNISDKPNLPPDCIRLKNKCYHYMFNCRWLEKEKTCECIVEELRSKITFLGGRENE